MPGLAICILFSISSISFLDIMLTPIWVPLGWSEQAFCLLRCNTAHGAVGARTACRRHRSLPPASCRRSPHRPTRRACAWSPSPCAPAPRPGHSRMWRRCLRPLKLAPEPRLKPQAREEKINLKKAARSRRAHAATVRRIQLYYIFYVVPGPERFLYFHGALIKTLPVIGFCIFLDIFVSLVALHISKPTSESPHIVFTAAHFPTH